MRQKTKCTVLVLGFFILLPGCSHKVMQPEQSTWQSVPCEYKLEGENESVLVVRTQVVEFDSAKIVAHTLLWTVFGDTLCNQAILYPRECVKSENYAIFTADRCLAINSVLKSVELLIKKSD